MKLLQRMGREAVDLFRREAPQIILLDALMPRKDGFEAARKSKPWRGEELVPIIFLTSPDRRRVFGYLSGSGRDDFLSKPYNRIILKAKINTFNRMR